MQLINCGLTIHTRILDAHNARSPNEAERMVLLEQEVAVILSRASERGSNEREMQLN